MYNYNYKMSKVELIKIDLFLKIKYLKVNQINEAKELSVAWRRGNKVLESK